MSHREVRHAATALLALIWVVAACETNADRAPPAATTTTEDASRDVECPGDPKKRKMSLDELAACSRHADSTIRSHAVDELAKRPEPRATELLIERVEDDFYVACKAMTALVKRGDEDAVPAIASRLKRATHESPGLGHPKSSGPADDNKELRLCAVKALGSLGDRRAIPVLEGLLGDWLVGSAAAQALAKIGDEDALLRALTHASSAVQASAITGLGRIRSRRAIAPLIAIVRDGNANDHGAADALVQIGPDAIEPLEQLARSGDKRARALATEALERIRRP